MAIEILSRVRLPIVPVLPDEVARLGDLGGAAHYGETEPDNVMVGRLWATPNGGLSVWTGTAWLQLAGAVGPGVPPGKTVFDDGYTDWDSGYTNFDA